MLQGRAWGRVRLKGVVLQDVKHVRFSVFLLVKEKGGENL